MSSIPRAVDHPETVSNQQCTLCQGEQTLLHEAPSFDDANTSFSVMWCEACQVASTRPFLSTEALQPYYNSTYYGEQSEEAGRSRKFLPMVEMAVDWSLRKRAKQVLDHIETSNKHGSLRVLDVGCGRGNFISYLSRKGHTCTGVDISANDADLHPGVIRLQGTLETQNLPANHFDAVCIWHVLEHVQDPASTLDEAFRVMAPGAMITIAVPNFSSWQAKAFGPHWFHLDLPRHLYHFSVRGLRGLLGRTGFEVTSQSTLAWDQNLFGFVQSAQNAAWPDTAHNRLFGLLKNRGGKTASSADKKATLTLGAMAAVTALPALGESVLSAICGQGASLIVRARKRPRSTSDAAPSGKNKHRDD